MGLVMLGSGSEKALDEMLQYAHETQHEKIIRGLAMGIAFLMYGRAELADTVIDQLLAEKVRSSGHIFAFQAPRSSCKLPTLRTHSSDTVACLPSPLPMRVPPATKLSANFFT